MSKRPSIRTQIILILFSSTLLTLVLVGGIFLFFTASYARNLGQVFLQESARDIQLLLSSPSAQQIRNPVELSELLVQVNPVPRIRVRVVDPSRSEIIREILPSRRTELQNQLMMGIIEGSTRTDQSSRIPLIRPIPTMREEHQFPPRMGRMMSRDMTNPTIDQSPGVATILRGIDFGTMGFINPTRYEIALAAGNQGAIIQLDAPSEGIARLFTNAVQGMIVASFIALFITGILSLWAARTFTAPLLGFAQSLRQIQPEHLVHQIKEDDDSSMPAPWLEFGTTKEMQIVTESFHAMSEEIHKWYQKVLDEQETLKSFLADASHELRTPVMAATTFVDLAKTSLIKSGFDSPELNDRLTDIDRQILRMNQVVQKLLLSARSTSIGEQRELVDLKPMISQMVWDLQAAYPKTKVEVTYSFPNHSENQQHRLLLNKEQITTVLQILLENCVIHGSQPIQRFSDHDPLSENDSILLLTIEQVYQPSQNIDMIQLRISDQGPGVEQPELLGTYEFRKVRSIEGLKPYHGLGIGLITAKTLLSNMGGGLEFEQSDKGGLVALVSVPIRKE
jgi:signal transduction histidine kinase